MDKKIKAVCVECGNYVESSYTRNDAVEVVQGIIEVFVSPCEECFPLSDTEILKSPLLKPDTVAELFDVSDYTLRQWRKKGIGPKYLQVGMGKQSVIRYHRHDVQDFIVKSANTGDKSPSEE